LFYSSSKFENPIISEGKIKAPDLGGSRRTEEVGDAMTERINPLNKQDSR